jgi:outer membrane protein assembly factor BamB/subtilase family serine protease
MRKEIICLVLVAMLCAACAASAIAQTTPFVINGYIFNPDGSPCNGPDVHITNLNTSVNWNAKTQPTPNYYRLLLNSSSVSIGNILQFNISCSSQSKTDEYNIMRSDIDNGGITKNITFASNVTTVPVLDTPFMISGYIFNTTNSPCSGPDVRITNLDTSMNWTAKTHPTSNYYRLLLNSSSVSTGDILQFNISKSLQSKTVEYNIKGSDLDSGGITSFNVTFASNGINLSGYKINDANGNGLWNPGEQGIQGWNITLKNATGAVVSTASTNPQGYYEFTNLLPGSYNVSEEDKAGWMHTNASFKLVTLADKDLANLNFTNRPVTHTVPELDTMFVISGWTHYKDGIDYNNPVISITNLRTGDSWHPMTRSGYNYYRLILNATNISSGYVLQFNLTSDGNTNLTDYTITLGDINCSGLSDFNLISATAAIQDISVEIEMPEYIYPDYPNEIYVTVKNQGINDVGLFNLSFDVNETLVDTITIKSLQAGENTAVHFTWTPEYTGNYALSITADPEDLLNESNRENNKITKNVNVIPVSIIHVPDDYSTIQDAIDHAKPHTFIYLRDGEYLFSSKDFRLRIKDKHCLKLIGENKHAKVIFQASTDIVTTDPFDIIQILNSTRIELRGFRVEAASSERQISPVGIIIVENSANVTLRDMNLFHGGKNGACRYAVKLINSSDCNISGNMLSGTERSNSNVDGQGTGIFLVRSTNNLIRKNTIYNFFKCIDVLGDNNTIYYNNLYPHPKGGIYANNSGSNQWNSPASIKYLYSETIFRNYVGNHWSWEAAVDDNGDGIVDLPYSTDTLTDHYPLIEPHELTFDLLVSEIARPSRIYTGRNNRILVSIDRKGTYPPDEQIIVSLIVDDVETDYKLITIKTQEKRILRFTWVPEKTGTYELKIKANPDRELKIRESDLNNNEFLINVIVSYPFFDHNDNVSSALDFLNGSQSSSGSISGISNPAWAALSITAAGENPATGRWKMNESLIECIRNSPKLSISGMPSWTYPYNLNNLDDFAWTILVISAIGEDPADFGGVNYLVMLRSYYDGRQFQDPDLVEDDALAILALIACGEKNSGMVSNATDYIKTKQNENGGWNSSFGKDDVKVTSLVIQALVAAGDEDSQVIDKALVFLNSMQEDDGGFSDVMTTSYAVMAITAAGENSASYVNNNNKNPIDYLLYLQQADGSFNQTMNLSMYPPEMTTFPIQALVGVPHPVMIKTLREEPELPDISLCQSADQITIEDEVYINTTYTVSTKIRNNGGVFDVMLSSNGTLVNNQTVRSVWSDSTTPVTFMWKPESTGTHNLTIAADTDNRINERYEDNNRITRQVNVVLPDLYPDAIGAIILPPEVYVNATNSVTVLIRGRTDESFNVTLKADSEYLNEWMIEGINDFVKLSSDWRPPHTGNHSLELIVDDGDKVTESIETNNNVTRLVNVVFPDLVPTAITPCPVYVNATNLVIISIKGTAEGFDLSLIENGTEVGRTSNITCYGNLNVTVPWRPARLGNCTIRASIDPGNNITETNETNNNITRGFEVVRPDIVPVQITPDLIFLNETNRVIITINGTAEGFNATLLANGTCIGTGVDLDTYNGTIEFEWTPSHPGKYNLTVIIDPDNTIDETNETNNNLSTIITAAKRIDLKLLFPLGGEILTGMQNITWNATYGEPLSIDLLYSANKGYTWYFIEQNTTNSGCYEWNTEDVIDGKYIIKVIARWDDVTQEDWSDRLYVYNKKSATEWGEFHSNAGFSLSNAPDTNERAWTSQDIGAEGSSSLIVADGKVFVYCGGWEGMYSTYTYLVALNESNGKVLWGTRIGPRVKGSWATPTYNNGKIYVSSAQNVYCIDATKECTGPILWEFTFRDGGGSVNGGPVVADGKVYVGSWDGGHYYCLDAKTGYELWRFKINGNAQSTPAVAYGRVFFGDWNSDKSPQAYAVDMDDAYVFWNTTASRICGSFTVSDGIVYFSTIDYTFYALDAGNGTPIWKSQVRYTDSTPALYTPSSSSRSYVYVASGYTTKRMYCFNAKNGETIWTVDGLGHWTNSPAVSNDGKVFVGKSGGGGGLIGTYAGLYCLDALTGEEIWHSDSGGGSPAIANGRVYTTAGYQVIAFGSRSGTRPDLIVENVAVPDKLCVGKTINVTAIINNTGTSDVNESFIVELTYAPENEILVIGTISFDSLEMNNATNISFKWTPPSAGDYHLTVTVNAGSTVNEDEINNMKSLDVVVAEGYPDLIVTRIAAPYASHIGQVINITVDIENTGIDLTGPFDVGLSINDKPGENKTISLDNERANVTFNWTSVTDGSYTLKATADVNKTIDESDETNNSMEKEIHVLTNDTFFGYGPGYGGGTGGGSEGGIGSGDGTDGSGEAGASGMEYSGDTSSSVKDKMSDITGFLFGDASSGSSGGGGALPVAFIICLLFILGLLYHGRRSEKRLLNDEKHHLQLPSVFRRKKS